MDFKILKEKDFGQGKVWLLAELNLLEYVESLTEENFEFEVQRKIVKNKYLDGILSTIESGEPLPNITLAYHNSIPSKNEGKMIKLDNERLDILDGLQRTYRLWAFLKIFNFINEHSFSGLREGILAIKKQYPEFFENGIVDSKFFKLNFPDGQCRYDLKKKYQEFDLYFTIWTNLSESELVQKMLILNAGHKAVSTQHQFEILFLNLWKSLSSDLNEIRVVREKEQDFNLIKKGDRKIGEYLFSTIITSLMSLVLAKPQRISSDIIYKYDLINENEEGSSLQYAHIIFNSDFISKLLKKLYLIDKEVENKYKKDGVSWFGKDTTLNGIFAAIGMHLKLNETDYNSQLEKDILSCLDLLKTKFPVNLEIEKFNIQYDNLTGRSVNIGNLIRSVIMNYTLKRLKDESANWSVLFNQEMKRK